MLLAISLPTRQISAAPASIRATIAASVLNSSATAPITTSPIPRLIRQ